MLVASSLSSSPRTLPSPLSIKEEEGVSEFFIHKPSPPPRTQSPPHPTPLPPPPHRDGTYDCAPLPPSLLPGHPREGQSASLLGGKYLLLEEIEGASLHKCLHIGTNHEYVCKVMSRDGAGQRLLAAHYRVDGQPHINTIQEVVVGSENVYLVFPPCAGDLHSYVRSRRRLREAAARHLFRQVVSAVHSAHSAGIVLRDLKLRKFVFTDESRSELKLESLEDAVVLDSADDDVLSDKHGCPAYVSPEILKSNTRYSGRAADMWGLGVMLYTMLVGRYPFHGAEHSGLFAKIRRGHFNLPDSLSSRAKCLIRSLLKKDPEDRLSTEDVLVHPWLTGTHRERGAVRRSPHTESTDHCVPEFNTNTSTPKFEKVFRPASESAGPR
jgi:tribbles-like protein